MAEAPKVDELKAKHAELEAKLASEERRAPPNEQAITQIKRAKLRIKDRIALLSHAL